MIFQDPSASLNPRRRVRDIVAEGLEIWPDRASDKISTQVDQLLREVGINPDIAGDRKPSEFSGGQCQRVAVARALALTLAWWCATSLCRPSTCPSRPKFSTCCAP